MKKLTVIDIFCGAGGFSEGFRQQDFEIVMGIDNWKPAIDTFNYNFGLDCAVKNILDFGLSVQEIEALPDTDVIIGSPPCVSFSSSNKSGKADKSMGVKLSEIFFRIVAVKKFKPDSQLKAWLMENVTSSTSYLAPHYTFKDLNLEDWAKRHSISPDKIAIAIEGNSVIVNSAEYGSPQSRFRAITGEFIAKDQLIIPPKMYRSPNEESDPPQFRTLGFVKQYMPKPNAIYSDEIISDPFYPEIKIKQNELSDHFYDTGLYKCIWKHSAFLKTNHPYMGAMSFPENENKPSRTITATNIGTSREVIIYKSEYEREGDGRYRTLTVREAATIMSFPYTYQFIGSENIKHRLVGNAVCPSVSRNFAATIRKELNLTESNNLILCTGIIEENSTNLNTYLEKTFNKLPQKAIGSRFRRHPFKHGNMTVTLSNYDITISGKNEGRWMTSVQYGNGKGFPCDSYPDGFYANLENVIEQFEYGKDFIGFINNGFSEKIAKGKTLQEMYESRCGRNEFVEPTELVERVAQIINQYDFKEPNYTQDQYRVFTKSVIPKKQVMALYAINRICSIANG